MPSARDSQQGLGLGRRRRGRQALAGGQGLLPFEFAREDERRLGASKTRPLGVLLIAAASRRGLGSGFRTQGADQAAGAPHQRVGMIGRGAVEL
jgi:hypothetical protein